MTLFSAIQRPRMRPPSAPTSTCDTGNQRVLHWFSKTYRPANTGLFYPPRLFARALVLVVCGCRTSQGWVWRALGMRYDPPNDYGCDAIRGGVCLSDYISMAIAAGLTVEEQTQRLPSGGGSEGGGGGGGGDKSGSSGGGDKSSSSGASKTSSGSAKSESAIFARFVSIGLGRKSSKPDGSDMGHHQESLCCKGEPVRSKCGTYWDPLKENREVRLAIR